MRVEIHVEPIRPPNRPTAASDQPIDLCPRIGIAGNRRVAHGENAVASVRALARAVVRDAVPCAKDSVHVALGRASLAAAAEA